MLVVAPAGRLSAARGWHVGVGGVLVHRGVCAADGLSPPPLQPGRQDEDGDYDAGGEDAGEEVPGDKRAIRHIEPDDEENAAGAEGQWWRLRLASASGPGCTAWQRAVDRAAQSSQVAGWASKPSAGVATV